MIDLKACPFCGSKNISIYTVPNRDTKILPFWERIPMCKTCGAQIRNGLSTEEAVAKAWNARAEISEAGDAE